MILYNSTDSYCPLYNQGLYIEKVNSEEANISMCCYQAPSKKLYKQIDFISNEYLSKINTADNVFGIFTSRAMRERGRYQIQLMKTRSSSGVGMKVDLEFDIDSLRIRDLGEYQQQSSGFVKKPSILDGIKTQSRVTGSEDVGKVSADIQSAKLKQLLGQIKSA